MTALGLAIQDLLGTSTLIYGAAVVPTSPASMSVQVNPGQIYAQAALEPSAWSSLPANSTLICKQGLLFSAKTLACAAPVTSGQSINYLIEGQYQENDISAQALDYWNSSEPEQPFSGANNNGISQPTVRAGQFVVQTKAGTAATTGTQTTPAADSGWVPLAVVTSTNGASSLVSGNIAVAAAAPYTSGAFTLTVASGLGTTPSGTAQYRINGSQATLILPASLTGTSGATGFTASGLPALLQPATGMPTQQIALPWVTDNSANKAGGYVSIPPQSGTLSFGLLGSLTGWTGSGTKTLPPATVSYPLY